MGDLDSPGEQSTSHTEGMLVATLYIGVWGGAGLALVGEPLQEMAVTISGTSAQSVPVSGPSRPTQRQVRLFTDTDCFVTWGANPTALNNGTGGRPLGAENPEVFTIDSGSLIAVIERV